MQKALAFWRIPLPAGFLERGQALPGDPNYQGITSDPCRKPGLSGVFHYQLDF